MSYSRLRKGLLHSKSQQKPKLEEKKIISPSLSKLKGKVLFFIVCVSQCNVFAYQALQARVQPASTI